MTDRELMQQALLKMEYMLNNGEWYKPEKVIEALRARLAQPEPEPVAWVIPGSITQDEELAKINSTCSIPLYAAPPQREWQGLTDEEAFNAFGFHLWPKSFLVNVSQELKDTHEEAKKEVLAKIRAIEAKLKEKNT